MELKTYQLRALDAFSHWLEVLNAERDKSEKMVETLTQAGFDITNDIRNYPQTVWDTLKKSGEVVATAGEYVNRTDEAGRPIPHICFKVPTGGGKTLLAAAALERLHRQTGLTLWVVPSRAIYDQTKAALVESGTPVS